MKKLINLSVILCVSIFILGCNRMKKDWEAANQTNKIVEYQNFISKYPSSPYSEKAIFIIDSFQWINVLNSKNIDTLEAFLEKKSLSKFLLSSPSAIDSLEWNIACLSKDIKKLKNYQDKYPNSVNAKKIDEIIWNIQWPPVYLGKAASVSIFSNGRGIIYGEMAFSMGSLIGLGGSSKPTPEDPAVYIWRNFSVSELNAVNEIGLRAGYAYLKNEGSPYKLIRKIDLSKTDRELCTEFGVNVNQLQ